MSSTTRTVETAHGDVTYQTVECASCGVEVSADEAARFVVAPERDRREWSHTGVVRLEFDEADLVEGWACRYCREAGPAAYPAPTASRLGRVYENHLLDDRIDALRTSVFLYVCLSALVILSLGIALLA